MKDLERCYPATLASQIDHSVSGAQQRQLVTFLKLSVQGEENCL